MKKILVSTMAAVAGLAVSAATLPEPVVWYAMDDLSGADASGNGFVLEEFGPGASVTNLAASGSALWFDGSTNAYARSAVLPELTDRTVSLWIWQSPQPGEYGREEGNFAPTVFYNLSRFSMRTDNSLETLSVAAAWLGEGGAEGGCYLRPFPSFCPGVWTHLAATVDVKSTEEIDGRKVVVFDARLYVNGRLSYDGSDLVTTNGHAAARLWIGNQPTFIRPFTGAVDELRVFDRVLTGEEIGLEFGRTGASTAKLVAWHSMDDAVAEDGVITVSNRSPFNSTALTADPQGVSIVDGYPGKALRFDGSADAWAKGRALASMTDSSWAFWINVATNLVPVVSGDNFQRVFSCGNTSAFFIKGHTSRDVSYTLNGVSSKTLGGGLLGKGIWQHWVFVNRYVDDYATGSTNMSVEVWINGIKAADSGAVYAAEPVQIGNNAQYVIGNSAADGTGHRVFQGDISDVRIFAGALSSNEIVRLYRGAAKVSAGEDFSTVSEETVLAGTVAAAGGALRFGYAGEVGWRMVSGPAPAVFLRPGNPVTEVSLPEAGEYVFELSCKGSFGDVRADTVTVTRVAESAANNVPTLAVSADADRVELPSGVVLTAETQDADADAVRIRWSKKSGPGGVFFVPRGDGGTLAEFTAAGDYTLVCTADDGKSAVKAELDVSVTAATVENPLEDELVLHWAFDERGLRELVSDTVSPVASIGSFGVDFGVAGNAVRVHNPLKCVNTGKHLPETAMGAEGYPGDYPADEWRTVSAWIRPDEVPAWTGYAGAVMHINSSLCISYGVWDNNGSTWTARNGFAIAQQGVGGYPTHQEYSTSGDFSGKWTHVCALVNRHNTTNSVLYVDGVRLEPSKNVGNTYGSSSAAAIAGKPTGGRIRQSAGGHEICLGGVYPTSAVSTNGWNSQVVRNDSTGEVGYRAFPGVIDDVRVYSRALTEGEVRALAQRRDPGANLAPVVGEPVVAGDDLYRKAPLGLSAEAHDDGTPGGALAYVWHVVEGDAHAVTFSARGSPVTEVTVTKAGKYTFMLEVFDGERRSFGPPRTFTVKNRGMVINLR